MIEQTLKFTVQVENEISHWIVRNGVSLDIAEKMILQFLNQLAQIKLQQQAQKADIPVETPVTDESAHPIEQPKQE